ncbi:MAG: hypothetical protein MJE77_28395 [Proteobacteria bacterium]|nr:hypothetical protein [Pseudomonadota bacterium]
MSVRVDFEARVITAGIRELVTASEPTVRSMGLFFQLRAELGREVHGQYRAEQESHAGFAAEVPVSLICEIDGFTARLRGRIDGLIDDGSVLAVEEVKSMPLGRDRLAELGPDQMPAHAMQARLYGLAMHQREPERAIAVRLILVSIVDGSRRSLDVAFDPQATRAALDRLVRTAIAEARVLSERAQKRQKTARCLQFPYPSSRPQQDQLVQTIARGLDHNQPVLVSAPTGIGKTVSALLPGLRHALLNDVPLYFATAKSTQRELVAQTFIDIAIASGLDRDDLTAVTLRAKEQMCPPGHLMCHAEHCSYLAKFAGRAADVRAIDQLVAEDVQVSPDRVYQFGQANNLCPFELLLRVAERAELVICDYNHVYNPAVARGVFASDRQDSAPHPAAESPAVVIVDEAHNLFDRARDHESLFLGRAALTRIVRSLMRTLGGDSSGVSRVGMSPANFSSANSSILRANSRLPLVTADRLADDRPVRDNCEEQLFIELADLCIEVRSYIDRAATAAMGPLHVGEFVDGCTTACDCCGRDAEAWRGFAGSAARLALRYALYLRNHNLSPVRDPIVDALQAIGQIRDGVVAGQPTLVPYVATEHAPRGVGFGLSSIDPAPRLALCHRRARGTVAMSATLSPVAYFADVLGFADMDPLCIAVPSPFSADHRHVVIVPTVATTHGEKADHYPAIARIIADIIAVKPGRYAAFFPSFAFLTRVCDQLPLRRETLFVQLPEMPPLLRDKLLDRFRQSARPGLLCAVMGGVFAEGIDLPGDQLIGAIIVGPGLPAVGFERVLMSRYFDDTRDSGFAYAMLYPGMQRVVQAAGRVIRTMNDRGIIALLGQRFATSQYSACLPPEWHMGDPSELVTDDPTAVLAEFWASVVTD